MNKKVSIDKVIINISGKEITVTVDELKELYEKIGQLLNKNTEPLFPYPWIPNQKQYPYPYTADKTWPTLPSYPDPYGPTLSPGDFPEPYRIICGNVNSIDTTK